MSKLLLLLAGLGLLYVCFLTRTFYWDGVLFSLYIEQVHAGLLPPALLFHPNHLLYTGLGFVLYSLFETIGLHVRAITVFQIVNVLASLVSAALVFFTAKRLLSSISVAITCALLFACGATWWKFSTDADSYVLSTLLLLSAIVLLTRERQSLIGSAVCLVFAMLFHQLAVFGYAPVVAAMYWNPGRRLQKRLALYLSSTAAAVGVVYVFVYRLTHPGGLPPFLGWITSFSPETKTTHSLQQVLVANSVSYLKLFGGGKLTLIREYLSVPVVFSLICAVICLALAIAFAFRSTVPVPTGVQRTAKISKILWLWLLPYVLFLSWFEPGNAFYKLFIWPPIVLLIGMQIDRLQRGKQQAFTWAVAALIAWNFGAFIYPHSHSSADPVLALAEKIDRELPQDAMVYYKVLSADDWYLEYFAPGRRWAPLSSFQEMQRSAPVSCFETTALPFAPAATDLRFRWDLVDNRHNVRLECLKSR